MSLKLTSPGQDRIAKARHALLEKAWRRGEPVFPTEKARQRATLEEAIPEYLATRKNKVVDSTLVTDRRRLNCLASASGVRFVHEVRKKHVQRLLDGVLEHRSPNTYNQYLFIVRGFLRWAVAEELASSNAAENIRQLKSEPPAIIWLTAKQRSRVLAAAAKIHEGHYLPLVATALYAGPRFSELRRMRAGDVDLARRTITIRNVKTKKQPRVVPLHSELQAILKTCLKGRRRKTAPLFTPRPSPVLGEDYRRKLMAGPIEGYLENFMHELGKKSRCTIGWNIFRHTFASLLAQRTDAPVTLDQIAQWLGNSPAVCRRHYARFKDAYDSRIET